MARLWGLAAAAAAVAAAARDKTSGIESFHSRELDGGFHSDIDDVFVSAGFQHTCIVEQPGGDSFGGPIRCFGLDNFGQSSPPEVS